jgi:hypothetical protein
MFTSWAVVAPGALRTRVVAFEFSRSARHLGVAERLAGVELVLIDRTLAAVLGILGGGVLVRRTRAALFFGCSGAIICYIVAWGARWLFFALDLPNRCLELVPRACQLDTANAKRAAAAI